MAAIRSVEGMVASTTDLANFTRNTLVALERKIANEMSVRQFGAFVHGGHKKHGGMQWASLSPNTVALKTALGFPRPAAPLVRSGYMSQRSRAKVQLRLIGNSVKFSVWVWNDAPYAKFHDSGFRNVWTGTYVPARHPVEITQADLAWVIETIRGFMGPEPKNTTAPKPKPTLIGRVIGFFGRFFGR